MGCMPQKKKMYGMKLYILIKQEKDVEYISRSFKHTILEG